MVERFHGHAQTGHACKSATALTEQQLHLSLSRRRATATAPAVILIVAFSVKAAHKSQRASMSCPVPGRRIQPLLYSAAAAAVAAAAAPQIGLREAVVVGGLDMMRQVRAITSERGGGEGCVESTGDPRAHTTGCPPAELLTNQGVNGHTTRAPPPGTKQSVRACVHACVRACMRVYVRACVRVVGGGSKGPPTWTLRAHKGGSSS
jgi:hypothetical protein